MNANELRRRDFLTLAGAGTLAYMLPWKRGLAWARDKDDERRSLIIIYLRGGMDALNVVVPHGDDRYYELRSTIAIPRKDSDAGPGVLVLLELGICRAGDLVRPPEHHLPVIARDA